MKRIYLGLIVAFTFLVGSGEAQDVNSARVLYSLCKDKAAESECTLILFGMRELLKVVEVKDPSLFGVCSPDSVTLQQEQNIFLAFVARHPDYLTKHASIAYIHSMKFAFPC